MNKAFEFLYLAVGVVEIGSEATGNQTLRFFTKPLLMILLIAYYTSAVQGWANRAHRLIVSAFIFSWVGDVALMFVGEPGTKLMGIERNPNYFLLGLVGFLITHVLYTIAFTQVSYKEAKALLPAKSWVLVPLVLYMVALLSLLVPAISGNDLTKPFLIPVLVYSTAIAVMVLFAINRYKRVSDRSFALVFAGALLFMLSDSIIAINKFLHPFASAGIFIMVLYISGQYLIAKGMLTQFGTNTKG